MTTVRHQSPPRHLYIHLVPHVQLPVRHLLGALQTQDHPDKFHSSSWGSFTSEPITSANLLSTENQSSFLLTPVTSSSQSQVLMALTLSLLCCYCCHHSSRDTPFLSELQQEPPGETFCLHADSPPTHLKHFLQSKFSKNRAEKVIPYYKHMNGSL